MFQKRIINFSENVFDSLSQSANFEDITNGRKGGVLVDCGESQKIPIVRTTTNYNKPAQQFQPIHYKIADKIKQAFPTLDIKLNNAMIEIYDSGYRKMGFHTDQSLDLMNDSYICIFSCYDKAPNQKEMRQLIVHKKTNNVPKYETILMENNSVILFSKSANHLHKHKIILDPNVKTDKKWIGITFRLSKTFIEFVGNDPYITCGNETKLLRFAGKEKGTFYRLKGNENSTVDFVWPEIDYTLSKNDLMKPTTS